MYNMHKVKIPTDTLDAASYYILSVPCSEDTIIAPAEIQIGPDGIEIYVWSSHPQSFFDE